MNKIQAGLRVLFLSIILTGNTHEAFGNGIDPSFIKNYKVSKEITVTLTSEGEWNTFCYLNSPQALYSDSNREAAINIKPLPQNAIVKISRENIEIATSIQYGKNKKNRKYWFPIIGYQRYNYQNFDQWTMVQGYQKMYILISDYQFSDCPSIAPTVETNNVKPYRKNKK